MKRIIKHVGRKFSQSMEQLVGKDFKQFKYLVAVSGGHDSMALATMCVHSELAVGVAHCNFGLRGAESDDDQVFVENYFKQLGVSVFSERFDTQTYAKARHVGIQVAARMLRYAFFEQLCEEQGFDFLLTAHHADDNVETFILNLARGSGLQGLTGIPGINGSILRPLLHFERSELELWNEAIDVTPREDSSNKDTKYLRNQVRLNVLPQLNQTFPTFNDQVNQSMKALGEVNTYILSRYAGLKSDVIIAHSYGYDIDVTKIKENAFIPIFLRLFLNEYDFPATTISDLIHAVSSKKSGLKFLNNKGLTAYVSRQYVTILNRDIHPPTSIVPLSEGQFEWMGHRFVVTRHKGAVSPELNSLYLPVSLLDRLMTIRSRKDGDYILPFGMAHGKQKIQDVFTNHHLTYLEKELQPVVLIGDDIVWVPGLRRSRLFLVNPEETLIKITFQRNQYNHINVT